MKVLVFGSVNIDRTYAVDHPVLSGETISARSVEEHCGGKGFNQAIALARAGAEVSFAGAIGSDGGMLEQTLVDEGIDSSNLIRRDGPTGHAIIQLDRSGQNCIIVFPGTNGTVGEDDVDRVLTHFGAGDTIVLQNEMTSTGYAIKQAHDRGMTVVINPSPFDEEALSYDLSLADYLIVNESEGSALTGEREPDAILRGIRQRLPHAHIVVTLGEEGSSYIGPDGGTASCGCLEVDPVDTTGAGDTFTGFFLAEMLRSGDPASALRNGAVASGISVTRHGAASSIPFRSEVEQYMEGDR